jgi:hypothetical protein
MIASATTEHKIIGSISQPPAFTSSSTPSPSFAYPESGNEANHTVFTPAAKQLF